MHRAQNAVKNILSAAIALIARKTHILKFFASGETKYLNGVKLLRLSLRFDILIPFCLFLIEESWCIYYGYLILNNATDGIPSCPSGKYALV